MSSMPKIIPTTYFPFFTPNQIILINFCHLGAGFASAEVEPQQKYKFVKKVKLRKYKFANGKNLHLDVDI